MRYMFLIAALFVWAGQPPVHAEHPLLNQSTRIENLGGVYASLPGNLELLTLNPASLEEVQDSKLTLFSIMLDFNRDTVSTVSDFWSAYRDVEDTHSISAEDMTALGEYKPHFRFSGPFQISYVRRHWGLSLTNINARLSPRFLRPQGNLPSRVWMEGAGESAVTFAYGRRVYGNLSAGLSLRYQVRADLRDTDVDATNDEDVVWLRRGLGYDLGLLYAMQRWPLHIGFVWHDLFNTTLAEQEILLESGDTVDGKDRVIGQQLRLGVTYQPDFKLPFGRMAYYPLRTLLSLEFGSGNSFGERLHIGTEVQLFQWLVLRFGINDGVRLGFGLGTQTFFLDYMFATSLEGRSGVHSVSIMWRY